MPRMRLHLSAIRPCILHDDLENLSYLGWEGNGDRIQAIVGDGAFHGREVLAVVLVERYEVWLVYRVLAPGFAVLQVDEFGCAVWKTRLGQVDCDVDSSGYLGCFREIALSVDWIAAWAELILQPVNVGWW